MVSASKSQLEVLWFGRHGHRVAVPQTHLQGLVAQVFNHLAAAAADDQDIRCRDWPALSTCLHNTVKCAHNFIGIIAAARLQQPLPSLHVCQGPFWSLLACKVVLSFLPGDELWQNPSISKPCWEEDCVIKFNVCCDFMNVVILPTLDTSHSPSMTISCHCTCSTAGDLWWVKRLTPGIEMEHPQNREGKNLSVTLAGQQQHEEAAPGST